MTKFEKVIAGLTAATVLIAASTWVVIWLQMKQARLEQRPWVTFEAVGAGEIQYTRNDAGETSPSAQMNIFNSGKTPAMSVDVSAMLTIVPNGTDTPDQYIGTGLSSFTAVMYPNHSMPMNLGLLREDPNSPTRSSSRYLSPKEYEDFTKGFTYVVVIARGKYEDIFGTEHSFRYCSAVASPAAKIITSRNCVAWNYADSN